MCIRDSLHVFQFQQIVARGNAGAQVIQKAVRDVVDPAVNSHGLTPLPCLLDDRRAPHILDLLDDVQLTEPVYPFFRRGKHRQFGEASFVYVTDMTKPVIDQPVGIALKRGADATASIVATDDYMFDLQSVSYTHLRAHETVL